MSGGDAGDDDDDGLHEDVGDESEAFADAAPEDAERPTGAQHPRAARASSATPRPPRARTVEPPPEESPELTRSPEPQPSPEPPPSPEPSPEPSPSPSPVPVPAAAAASFTAEGLDAGASYVDDFPLDDEEPIGVRINRRWARAKTDLYELGEELRGHYWRLDLVVIVAGLAIAYIAAVAHRGYVSPATVEVSELGLTFRRTTAWLAPEVVPPAVPRLLRGEAPPRPRPGELPSHAVYTSSIDPDARLEILIDARPPWSNILTGLELDRRTRWGELYHADPGQVRAVAGHDWLRTSFRYAHAPAKGDEPVIGHAVEYATIDREHLYAITFYGTPAEIEAMEQVTAPTLRVQSRSGMPLLPRVDRMTARGQPHGVGKVFPSTVMVVVADIEDGRLRARGGGSGFIVDADGSIITNYHVVHDKDGRLHDLFVIGRHLGDGRPPELICAGKPNRSKLQPDLDLALVKCDLDLDGRPWTPSADGEPWPAVDTARAPDLRPGQRLWAIGYPDVGGGGIMLTQGLVEGWTGQDGGLGRDYLKTDASITHGNSGGPVVDDDGNLIGIATAFRIRISASGGVVETAKVGLVRPLSAASELLAIARAGWIPREGRTAVELEPRAVEAPPEGIRLSTNVVDAGNGQPVAGALLMVLRPGIGAADIDVNRLDDLVIAWGRSNADGDVHLKQAVPVPGTYSVLVVARGYDPLVGDNELRLAADAPPFFDPWGVVKLEGQ
jgi:S1-C subfamily serine protease